MTTRDPNIIATFSQTAHEILDYEIDWDLKGDEIESVAWSAGSGVTIGTGPRAPHNTTTTTTVWLSGTSGAHLVSCIITTTGGRVVEKKLALHII